MICTICDDDLHTVSKIHESLDELYAGQFEYKLAYGLSDFEDGSFCDCDILIIDIDLKRSDGSNSGGIAIAQLIKKKRPDLQVIFESAFHEYAQDIFEAEPVYYIQKPISKSKLKTAVDKAISKIHEIRGNRFSFASGRGIISVPMADILYIESRKRQMKIFTYASEYTFYSTVKDTESRLDDRFVKCHQSFLVNLEHVRSMTSDRIVMDNGSLVPISQSRCKDVKIALTRFLGKSIA